MDTMALAAQLSLPLSLEKLSAFFGLEKDMEGHRVMKKLSRPRRPSRDNPDEFWERDTKPEDFDLLDEYNIGDVEVMRQCFYKMLPLTQREQRVWELTREMNDRGIRVDLSAVRLAKDVVQQESHALRDEFQNLVGCSPQASVKVAEWCGVPDVTASTVEAALQRPLAEDKRRALQLRQLLSKSSLAKLDQLLLRTSPDGRLRGSLVYAGAQRTGRWASRGVQLQNIRRGMGELSEVAVDCLVAGWSANSWLKLMPDLLRSFLVGPFTVGDFSQIEARILAWLAKDIRLVQEFAEKKDPYRSMAAAIYRVPREEVSMDQRFMGKRVILGCGYQMGAEKFFKAAEGLVSRGFAERIINTYRVEHEPIKRYWYAVQRKFEDALEGSENELYSRCLVKGVKYLRCKLPSGRSLWYANPHRDSMGNLRVFTPSTFRPNGEQSKVYGGRLVENIVQATARDVLVEALLRLDAAGYPLVLIVHDEIVVEGQDRAEEFTRLMKEVPSWAQGLPIDVETFTCERYRK
jgi:DNA polymerase